MLVLSFAWAAISKVLTPRRWRAALVAVGVPSSLRPTVGWVVPATEVGVVLAGLLGLHRVAAVLALALLAAFSAALGMRRLRGERRLTCGCFGGSRDVHVGAALARNAALGAAAALSLGVPDASLRWPGWPSGPDLLPAALAAAGLAAALTIALAFARALRRAT